MKAVLCDDDISGVFSLRHFMEIVSLGDNFHEMSRPNFYKKKKKKIKIKKKKYFKNVKNCASSVVDLLVYKA